MSFEERLDEVYQKLGTKKSKKITIPKPILERGTTKIHWKNVKQLLKIIRRPPDHFISFLNSEIDNKASWKTASKSDGMLLTGRFTIKDIYRLITKYLNTYVTCSICQSVNTSIKRDVSLRKYQLHCKNCLSINTVN